MSLVFRYCTRMHFSSIGISARISRWSLRATSMYFFTPRRSYGVRDLCIALRLGGGVSELSLVRGCYIRCLSVRHVCKSEEVIRHKLRLL